jgi:hypothetical protein
LSMPCSAHQRTKKSRRERCDRTVEAAYSLSFSARYSSSAVSGSIGSRSIVGCEPPTTRPEGA